MQRREELFADNLQQALDDFIGQGFNNLLEMDQDDPFNLGERKPSFTARIYDQFFVKEPPASYDHYLQPPQQDNFLTAHRHLEQQHSTQTISPPNSDFLNFSESIETQNNSSSQTPVEQDQTSQENKSNEATYLEKQTDQSSADNSYARKRDVKAQEKQIVENEYVIYANKKIKEWKKELEKPGLPREEKRKIQNKISAMQQRSKQKQAVSRANGESEQVRKRIKDFIDVLDEHLCDACKESMIRFTPGLAQKKQKVASNTNKSYNLRTPELSFKNLLIAFLACLSIVSLVANPNVQFAIPEVSTQQETFSEISISNIGRSLSVYKDQFQNTKYQVYHVLTSTYKQFTLVAYPNEQILDLKERIEMLQGIPSSKLRIMQDGEELEDLIFASHLDPREDLFVLVEVDRLKYRFEVRICKQYLEGIKMVQFMESYEPITLRDYKRLVLGKIGMQYGRDYHILYRGQKLEDDDFVISDQEFIENYIIQYTFDIEETVHGFKNFMIKQPVEAFFNKVVDVQPNLVTASDSIRFYNVNLNSEENSKIEGMLNFTEFDWKEMVKKYEKNMFIVDLDSTVGDSEDMVVMYISQYNEIVFKRIACRPEAPTIPDKKDFLQKGQAKDLHYVELYDNGTYIREIMGDVRIEVTKTEGVTERVICTLDNEFQEMEYLWKLDEKRNSDS